MFDLDGTIISTVGLHEQGWRVAGEKCGVRITDEMLRKQRGIPEDAAARMMLGSRYAELGGEFVRTKRSTAVEHAGEVRLYPDFLPAYRALRERGLVVWVCTSAPKVFVGAVYGEIPELAEFKDRTVYREMYEMGKPHPDPLLLTARKMGVPIEQVLYVGDAVGDWKAAENAGCAFLYACREKCDPQVKAPAILDHREILDFLE